VIDPAQDWEQIRAVTRQVAAAVGEAAAGERLLGEMDATLAAMAGDQPARPVRVVGWGGSGADVPGRDTLFNTLLETAGGMNVAAPWRGRGSFDLEEVVLARPEVLLRGAAYAATPAVRNQAAAHRLLRRLHPQGLLTYPEAIFGCGSPSAAAAALRLRPQLRAARPRG
jgi:iron complex transport system substrate-binding protein